MSEIETITDSDMYESSAEIEPEKILEYAKRVVSDFVQVNNMSEDNVLSSNSEGNSVAVNNTLTDSVSNTNCSEICMTENAVISVVIKDNDIISENIPSVLVSSSETNSVSNSYCPEINSMESTAKTVDFIEHDNDNVTCLLASNSETNSETVSNELTNSSNSNCSEMCSTENTVKTVDSVEQDIISNNVTSDDVMDLVNEVVEPYSHDIDYDFNQKPIQITKSVKEFNAGKKDNFTKGCKWAPDGSCILTCSDDNKLRLFNLPSELWDSSKWSDSSELEAVLTIPEGGLIYDYCWYPFMNSNDVSTCCEELKNISDFKKENRINNAVKDPLHFYKDILISCSKRSTVHMWDGYTGELRCSYRSFNHLDELVTPNSLSFDSDGGKIFCGYRNIIRIFDVNRPGRYCEERPVYAYKTGQYGIISCFAFTSTDKNVSAAGSYNGTIGLYAEPFGELSCLIEGQEHGITQLQFSPDGKYLYSGGRKDSDILCWDLRNLGCVLFSLRRTCDTNQRIYFDISKCGKYIVTGNQNGIISFWDVTKEPKILNENDFPVLAPINFFMAHNDCVNGVSFHPSYPLLCSSSGQRHFPEVLDDSDSEDIFSFETKNVDNSLRLWWIGK